MWTRAACGCSLRYKCFGHRLNSPVVKNNYLWDNSNKDVCLLHCIESLYSQFLHVFWQDWFLEWLKFFMLARILQYLSFKHVRFHRLQWETTANKILFPSVEEFLTDCLSWPGFNFTICCRVDNFFFFYYSSSVCFR